MNLSGLARIGRRARTAPLMRRLATVGLSVGVRGVFGLVLATVIVSRYPATFSVEFFQLLLLQSVFLTFVSGSGYAHAVAASENERGAQALVRNYLAFVLIVVAATAVAEILLPSAFIAHTISPDRWKINLLIVGGVAISLHAILQGVIVERVGTFRTFLPTSLAGLGAAGAVLASQHLPPAAMFVAFVGYQLGSLILLIVINPTAARILVAALRWGDERVSPVASARILGIALINTAFLLIFYAYRQSWSGQVPAVESQGAFFGLRLSDTYLQILVLGAAQSNPLRLKGGRPPAFFYRAAAGGAILSALTVAAVLGVLHAAASAPLIVCCIMAQILCEVLRIPGSLANMAELQTGSPARYAVSCLAPMVVAYGFSTFVLKPADLSSIYIFQLIVAALQIMAYCLIGIVHSRRPGTPANASI